MISYILRYFLRMIELYARKRNDTFFFKVTYLNMTLFPEYDIIWLCCTGPSKSKSCAGIYLHSLSISTSVCIGNLRRPLFNNTRQNWLRRMSISKRHHAFWYFIIIVRLNKMDKTNFTLKKIMVKSYIFNLIKKRVYRQSFWHYIFIRGSALNTTFNAVPYMIHSPDKARMW